MPMDVAHRPRVGEINGNALRLWVRKKKAYFTNNYRSII